MKIWSLESEKIMEEKVSFCFGSLLACFKHQGFSLKVMTGRLAQLLSTKLSVREVWGLRPGLVKSDTVSPTARHRCGGCFFGAVLPRR